MSDCIRQYPELVSHWGIYPRVHYFRGRFLDLSTRFKRIIAALPKVFHDEELMVDIDDLINQLKNKYISITVLGKENLSPEIVFVGKPGDVDLNSESGPSCMNVVLCYASVEGLTTDGLHQMKTVVQHASKSTFLQRTKLVDFLVIVCHTRSSFSEADCTEFHANLHKVVQTNAQDFVKKFEIIVSSSKSEIKYSVSLVQEKRIIGTFMRMHSYLDLFIKGYTQNCQNTTSSIPAYDSIYQRLKEYLCNYFFLSEINNATFDTLLIDRVARAVKCMIISPMSCKYVLPQWLCNKLLHEIQYEDVLVKSISANTKYCLGKLKRIHKSLKIGTQSVKRFKPFSVSKTSGYYPCAAVVQSFQKDFTESTTKAENVLCSMGSLSTVIKKMTFEIKGYLKQTIVQDVPTLPSMTSLNIPQGLRQDILAMHGVYGMGTMYGQLEVHVIENKEENISEMVEKLRKLTMKHHFSYPYTLKSIEQ